MLTAHSPPAPVWGGWLHKLEIEQYLCCPQCLAVPPLPCRMGQDERQESAIISYLSEFGMSSWRSQQRPFLPPCTPRSLGTSRGTKAIQPPKSGDVFARLCHDIGQAWAGAHSHKEKQPPRAGGDRGAIKLSQQLQAGQCLPCRTISSFGAAKDSLPASGPAAESCELFIKKELCGSQPAQAVNYTGINPKYIFKKEKSWFF